MMKRISAAAVLLSVLVLLTSCGGPKLIGIIPAFNGPAIYDTTHEFTKDEFFIYASYDDGTDRRLENDEFEFEVQGLKDGYYLIEITSGDETQMCYVECEVPVYPSDMAAAE